ncbi:hypothetical protein Tco_0121538 [Tanacetum coccineum]
MLSRGSSWYLKGKPNLGLWYPRDSPLDLEAFSDSDYGGSNLDRKSTTGGCQFLGQRLISWQCKKQTIVATSTTEAEYVAAAHCCGQVLWVQNQLLDYGFNFMNTKIHIDNESTICIVKNPVYHSKTKHIEIRHHFIRDCYEKKLISVEKIHTDLNVADLLTKPFDGPRFNYLVVSIEIVDFLRRSKLRYALTHNPPIYDSLVKQFWQTATVKTLADGTQQINATIDSVEYTITEESVRRQLQLADDSGITMLQNEEIFEGLHTIGYLTDGTFTFWKSHFTPQWRFLIHHILHCISSKSGGWDQFGSNIATALICLSTGRAFNFSKLIFDGMISNLKSKSKFLMYPRFLQMILNVQTENKNLFVSVLLTKKIFGNMKRGFQGIHRPLLPAMLTINAGQAQSRGAPTPSQPVPLTTPPHVSTPTPPHVSTPTPPPVQTPTPSKQSPPLTQPVPSPTPPPIPTPTPPPISTPTSPPPPPKTEPTTDEHIYEEQTPVHHHFSPSQAQAPSHMSLDDLLQTVPKLISRIDSLEVDLKQTKLTMGNAIVKLVKKVKKLEGFIQRRNLVLTDSEEEETEAQGIDKEPQDSSVHGLVTPPTTKDYLIKRQGPLYKGRRYKRRKETKGKKVVSSLDFQEGDAGTEKINTAGEINAASIEVNTASKVNTGSIELNTVIEARTFEAQYYTNEDWDLIRAKLEANAEVVKEYMLGSETFKEKDFAKRMVDITSRKKLFLLKKEQSKRNKPMTQSHLKTYMMNYLKNQGTWKINQLKKLSFAEVKEEFDKLVKQIDSFAPISFEATKDSLKRFW